MDIIVVDIAAMWPEEMCLPVLEIETEIEDNISTHLEEKMTWILDGIDKDQINNCITIPIGWKGWWAIVEKEARSIERERKKEERLMKEEERRRSERKSCKEFISKMNGGDEKLAEKN